MSLPISDSAQLVSYESGLEAGEDMLARYDAGIMPWDEEKVVNIVDAMITVKQHRDALLDEMFEEMVEARGEDIGTW